MPLAMCVSKDWTFHDSSTASSGEMFWMPPFLAASSSTIIPIRGSSSLKWRLHCLSSGSHSAKLRFDFHSSLKLNAHSAFCAEPVFAGAAENTPDIRRILRSLTKNDLLPPSVSIAHLSSFANAFFTSAARIACFGSIPPKTRFTFSCIPE